MEQASVTSPAPLLQREGFKTLAGADGDWTTGHHYLICEFSTHLFVDNQRGHPSFSTASCGAGTSKCADLSKKI